jgi:hypothetical protein
MTDDRRGRKGMKTGNYSLIYQVIWGIRHAAFKERMLKDGCGSNYMSGSQKT